MSELIRALRPGSGRMLVLLHGLGSNEQDLLALTPMLGTDMSVVALRAPLAYGPEYSWFPLEFDAEGGVSIDEAGAKDALVELIKNLEALKAESDGLVLGGFSQGAMMTLGILTQAPELLDGVVLMSGRYFAPLFVDAVAPTDSGLSILIQHGIYDPVLPVAGARQTKAALEALGYAPGYREYPMGHEVSQQSVADISGWLKTIGTR